MTLLRYQLGAEPLTPKGSSRRGLDQQSKLATARFYMARVLPETETLATNIMAGSKTLMALDAEAF